MWWQLFENIRSLWQFHRDELALNYNNAITDFPINDNSNWQLSVIASNC